ncbi:hypothetical protein BZG09_09215 [Salinivibrio kushneri]|uniref:Oligosaccharide repeat unit polymerase n=2 Tax=Salinivibrio kushneri TaxID=1908198 RepID=A0AB36K7I9_9GAMM|nr:hypothetical protein BZG09_09215 [Salinivibrio kushneri]
MRDSQIHVNVITLVGSAVIMVLCCRKVKLSFFVLLIVYFFVLQILLFLSSYFGLSHEDLRMSDILSILRPVLLFIIYLSMAEASRRWNLINSNLFIVIIVISFFYAIVEVFFTHYSFDVITFLYKREYRPELFFTATTFFGTTYYSGYVFYCLYLLSFVRVYSQKKAVDKLLMLLTFILVVLSLSKAMIAALLVATYLLYLITLRGLLIKMVVVFLPFMMIAGLILYERNISTFLMGTGIPALKSLNVLLYNTQSSGTLNVRIEQIVHAFESAQMFSPVFGAGLGKGVSLESLPASFLYRYGLLGLFFSLFIYISLLLVSLYKLIRCGKERYPFYLAFFVWVFTLPITQFSGVMIEQSKMAFFSAIMLGLLVKPRCEND